MRPSARYLCAALRVNSSQISGITKADKRPRRRALALDRRLQREAVHHGREHAHGVAGRPRHAAGGDFDAADHVAAAHDHGDLGAELLGRDQIGGDAVDGRLVDHGPVAAGEIFAGNLDHHATIDRLSHVRLLSLPRAAHPARGPRRME